MIHAKLIIIDARLAVVGPANMDIRSFQLNFELALFLYSAVDVRQIVSVVEKIIADSRLVNSE
jgi:cardiolipin synthase